MAPRGGEGGTSGGPAHGVIEPLTSEGGTVSVEAETAAVGPVGRGERMSVGDGATGGERKELSKK